MTLASELWPPAGLRISAGDLTLTPVVDDDFAALVALVRSGVHAPDELPFATPWTRQPPERVAPEYARYQWKVRAAFSPDDLQLDLAVRVAGEVVGVQGFVAKDCPVTRTAETASWLAQRHQGRGIGTRMRAAVCAFLLDHLDAAEVTSSAWADNPASLAVSRKVGYRLTDTYRRSREGRLVAHHVLRLGPDDLVRGEPLEVTGAEPLRAFLSLG